MIRRNSGLSQSLSILVEDAKFEAKPKGIAISSKIAPNIEYNGSESILNSGIENILRNAIRYAHENIALSLEQKDDDLIMTIEDDGCGVAPNQLKKIFEAFYRPQIDRSRDSGGVGLGLSIAAKSVQAHGGKIWAEAVNPQGLKIVIHLPHSP